MKNLLRKFIFCIAVSLILCSYAFADVVSEPMYAVSSGIPALFVAVLFILIAVLIILIAVIVYVIKRNKK